MKISKAVGIDLGTTNSVIAMIGKDNETIICRADKTGQKTFPSVVVYDKKNDRLRSGRFAFNARGTAKEPIVSIKSHMGDPNYTATTGGKVLTPIEVSAEILRTMKEEMQAQLNAMPEYADYVVDRAVITIPAYFLAAAREATTRAGELAGLEVEITLPEPTSSALYYCRKNDIDNGTFLVYDLGGGTFDVSIVQFTEGNAHVVGIAGNNYLGGDNLDAELAKYLLEEIQNDEDSDYELDLDIYGDEEDKRRFQKLKLVAENIKKRLSYEDEYIVEESGVFNDKAGVPVNLNLTVTRAKFEELIRPLLDSTLDECRKALASAEEKHGVTLDKIDGVLLVGGSTHVPVVAQIIEETFTSPSLPIHTKMPKPLKDEPDMAVGYGAAMAAANFGIKYVNEGEGEAGDNPAGKPSYAPQFNPAAGYGGLSSVSGKLNVTGGSLPNAIVAVVTRVYDGFEEEYPVQADGSFAFEELTAEEEPEIYRCKFMAGKEVLVEAEFDATPAATLAPPVTLSRNYYIETVNENTGRNEYVLLMESGLELPVSRDYEFTTNSTNRFFATLRFFEEKSFLKQIDIEFDTPVMPGTPIKLSIACDKKSIFSVSAEVAGQRQAAEFKASPAPEMPDEKAISNAFDAAMDGVSMNPNRGAQIRDQQKAKRIATGIREAMSENDAVKAANLMEQLKEMGRQQETARLEPDQDRFNALVAEVEELNANSPEGGAEIAAEIRKTAAAGRKAYESSDQEALSGAVDRLNKLKESVKKKDNGGGGVGTSPEPEQWQLCGAIAYQTDQYIKKALEKSSRGELPAKFCAEYLDPQQVSRDQQMLRRVMQKCMSECRMLQKKNCRETCEMWNPLVELYKKWHEVANLTGIPTKNIGF